MEQPLHTRPSHRHRHNQFRHGGVRHKSPQKGKHFASGARASDGRPHQNAGGRSFEGESNHRGVGEPMHALIRHRVNQRNLLPRDPPPTAALGPEDGPPRSPVRALRPERTADEGVQCVHGRSCQTTCGNERGQCIAKGGIRCQQRIIALLLRQMSGNASQGCRGALFCFCRYCIH